MIQMQPSVTQLTLVAFTQGESDPLTDPHIIPVEYVRSSHIHFGFTRQVVFSFTSVGLHTLSERI